MKCIGCTYTPSDGGSGGTVTYNSEKGPIKIDYKIQDKKGNWIINPLLEFLGLKVYDGKCNCLDKEIVTNAGYIGEVSIGFLGDARTGGILSNSSALENTENLEIRGKKKKVNMYGIVAAIVTGPQQQPFGPDYIGTGDGGTGEGNGPEGEDETDDSGGTPDFTLPDITPFDYGFDHEGDGDSGYKGSSSDEEEDNNSNYNRNSNDPRKKGLTYEGPSITDKPCSGCLFSPNPGDPQGNGTITYRSANGTTAFPYKVWINGQFVINPLLTNGGGSVRNGKCSCKKVVSRTSSNTPSSGGSISSAQGSSTGGGRTSRDIDVKLKTSGFDPNKNTAIIYHRDGVQVGGKVLKNVDIIGKPPGLNPNQTLDLIGAKFGKWIENPTNQQNLLNAALLGAGARSGVPFSGPKRVENWSSPSTRGLFNHPPFMDIRGLEPDIISDADIQDANAVKLANVELKFKLSNEIGRIENLIKEFLKDLITVESNKKGDILYNWGSGNDIETAHIIRTTIEGTEKRLEELRKYERRL